MPGVASRAASPPSIEDFASRPQVEEVSISPDGRYLAVIQTLDGRGLVVEKHFKPVAISAEDPDVAYTIGPSEGRDAIWLIDLKDKEDPKLLFSHPLVDVSHPILARDSRFYRCPLR
jgi:hypothetical protein